jgi:predicted nucleotidyltransferase
MRINSLKVSDEKIRHFCQRWKVSELAIFGSALREDYSQDSDVDILISFKPEIHWGLFDLVNMETELKTIFGKEIDLVEKNAVVNSENYIRRKGILDGAQIIFST